MTQEAISFYVETPATLPSTAFTPLFFGFRPTRVDLLNITNFESAGSSPALIEITWDSKLDKVMGWKGVASDSTTKRTLESSVIKFGSILNPASESWRAQFITSFTAAKPGVVTVPDASGFLVGDEVSITGLQFSDGDKTKSQFDFIQGKRKITAVTGTTITLNIDTSEMNTSYVTSSGLLTLYQRNRQVYPRPGFVDGVLVANPLLSASSRYCVTGWKMPTQTVHGVYKE